MSRATSITFCPCSSARILRMLASGPGCSPRRRADRVRMRMRSSNTCSMYTPANRCRITGSEIGPRSRTASSISSAVGPLPHRTPPVDNDTRSLPRVTFARRQPSSGSPTRFSTGRRTSVKNTSLKVDAPVISLMGRISIPGVSMGQTKYDTPLCFGASGFVRAMRIPYFACCAPLVQIF